MPLALKPIQTIGILVLSAMRLRPLMLVDGLPITYSSVAEKVAVLTLS